MATVTIVFTDKDDGDLGITMEFDPTLKREPDEEWEDAADRMTTAQQAAIAAVQYIRDELSLVGDPKVS